VETEVLSHLVYKAPTKSLSQHCIFITMPLTTHKAKVLSALRNVIKNQIDEFKRWNKCPKVCPVSGQRLTRKNRQVDHVIEFIRIVTEWLNSKGLSYEQIPVRYDCYAKRYTIADHDLRSNWQDVHFERPELSWIDKTANQTGSDHGFRKGQNSKHKSENSVMIEPDCRDARSAYNQ
jgi:hypothetical protein